MSRKVSDGTVKVPGQLLLAYLAGRVAPLDFARHFGWAGDIDSATNPFRERARAGCMITKVEVSADTQQDVLFG